MTDTLFSETLITREFGSLLFSVAELTEWAKSKRIHLPTIHGLESAEFIQVEYLLSAIGSLSHKLSESDALSIISTDENLKSDWAAKIAPAFAIGAQASGKWRELVTNAIDLGELLLLDFGSKLQVVKSRVHVSSDAETDFSVLATRTALIEAFGKFTGMNQTWFDNLTDAPKLMAARKYKGISGRRHAEPLFCPYEVMQWLIDPKRRKGTKLSVSKGWGLLKSHFPKVHNAKSIGDPNDD